MATSTVGSTGDYATLILWESAVQGTSDATETAQMQDEEHTNVSLCTIQGWTNDPDVVIEGIVTQDGSFTTGPRMTHTATAIQYEPDNITNLTVRDLVFDGDGSNFCRGFMSNFAFSATADSQLTIERCLFRDHDGSDSIGVLIEHNNTGTGLSYELIATINNCVFVGSGVGLNSWNSTRRVRGTANLNGCTLYDSYLEIRRESTDSNLTYNVNACLIGVRSGKDLIDYYTATTNGTFEANCYNSLTDHADFNDFPDTTSGNTANVTLNDSGYPADGEVSFVDATGGDLRLFYHPDNLAYEHTTEQSGLGYPSDDCLGRTRAATRSVGAFQSAPIVSSINPDGGADYTNMNLWSTAKSTSVEVGEVAEWEEGEFVNTVSSSFTTWEDHCTLEVRGAAAVNAVGEPLLGGTYIEQDNLYSIVNLPHNITFCWIRDLSISHLDMDTFQHTFRMQSASDSGSENLQRRFENIKVTETPDDSGYIFRLESPASTTNDFDLIIENCSNSNNSGGSTGHFLYGTWTSGNLTALMRGCYVEDRTVILEDNGGNANNDFHLRVEGCIIDHSSRPSCSGNGTSSVYKLTPVDCIGSHGAYSGSDVTAGDGVTNCTTGVTIHREGVEPDTGEVSLISTSRGDIRLAPYGDNLARGYATNVSWPATDMEGRTRTDSCGPNECELSVSTFNASGGADYSTASTWVTAVQNPTGISAVVLEIEAGTHDLDGNQFTPDGFGTERVYCVIKGAGVKNAGPDGTTTTLHPNSGSFLNTLFEENDDTDSWLSDFYVDCEDVNNYSTMLRQAQGTRTFATTYADVARLVFHDCPTNANVPNNFGCQTTGGFGTADGAHIRARKYNCALINLNGNQKVSWGTGYWARTGGSTETLTFDHDFRNCTFIGGGLYSHAFNDGTKDGTTHVQGCAFISVDGQASENAQKIRGGGSVHDFDITDMIRGPDLSGSGGENTSQFNSISGTQTNVNRTASRFTIDGSAPASASDLAFADLSSLDLRLVDHVDNLGVGYVTNGDTPYGDLESRSGTRAANWNVGVTDAVVAPASSETVVTPTAGSVSLTGDQPTVTVEALIAPTAGSISLSGYEPLIMDQDTITALNVSNGPGNNLTPNLSVRTATGTEDLDQAEFSWGCWIAIERDNSLSTNDVLFVTDKSGAPTQIWVYRGGAAGTGGSDDFTLRVDPGTGAVNETSAFTPASVGAGLDEWFHMAVVADGANGAKLYINGSEILHNTTSLAAGSGFELNTITGPSGRYSTADSIMRARNAIAYDGVLTDQEVRQMMLEDPPLTIDGKAALGYHPADHENRPPSTDRSGNGSDWPSWYFAWHPTYSYANDLSFLTITEVTPTAGTISLTGEQPAVTVEVQITPTAGTISLTGSQPSVEAPVAVSPTSGTVSLTGEQPFVPVYSNPAAGTFSLTGTMPTVLVGDDKSALPTAGTFTLTGSQPSVTANVSVAPSAGAFSLTGDQPTVTADVDVSPTAGGFSLTGSQPTISVSDQQSVAPTAGTFSLTGAQPTITNGGAVATITGHRVDEFEVYVSAQFDASITEYLWDWGDGVNSYGPNSAHSYEFAGVYNVTLTVTNGSGSDQTSVEVTVAPTESDVITWRDATDRFGLHKNGSYVYVTKDQAYRLVQDGWTIFYGRDVDRKTPDSWQDFINIWLP